MRVVIIDYLPNIQIYGTWLIASGDGNEHRHLRGEADV